jgi:hypothetical protein
VVAYLRRHGRADLASLEHKAADSREIGNAVKRLQRAGVVVDFAPPSHGESIPADSRSTATRQTPR